VKRSPFGRHLALAAAASLVMSACGAGGGGGGVAPPPVTGVSGNVTNTRGGPGVSGATITATNSMMSATTNAQGAYTLALNPATYDILAAAPGMAASKFQSVVVLANKTSTANLIMFPVFDPTKPVAAPTISLSGLTQGQTVTTPVTLTVGTVAASNPVRRIDIRVSNLNALTPTTQEFVDTNTATLTLNPATLANGPAFVDILEYDLNQNAAELMVAFTVSNTQSGTAPTTPTGFSLEAVTFGQSLGLFSTRRAQLFAQLGIRQDPHILTFGGRSINILTAPSNATLFVEPSWTAVTGATGYKVFRSSTAGGPFVLVAQVTSTFYDDTDPTLAPGVPVYYQVSAFNTGGESAPTASLSVTPLPAFNLNLTTPARDATGASTLPVFTWTPTVAVGTDQGYDVVVTGVNDPSPAWMTSGFSILDTTSVTYGAFPVVSITPLQSGKVYQWNIYEAVAQTKYASNSFAVAVANSGSQGVSGSLNGPFTFTTAP
jgi:Carboxypeptidase regulatory-like domain